ncbi:MAG TPA: oxygenase MpaB family protein [Stellaceae bacterium]|jgi:uncharacterized protein (DUF2236 family)|nr:oxygenase MpaB family protein [Stellaceae bacterium]
MGARDTVRRHIRQLVGFAPGQIDFDHPVGDKGLFGLDCMAWKIHSDFTTMMVGGITALLLQMLHPGALAGVWDHSNFREDMAGRLKRTAQFISGTTYAPTEQAMRLIERVRQVHDRVQGTLPDGTPYSANDPDLLTWVHIAEVSSFLKAFIRYRDPYLPFAQQDRYYAEVSVIAELLGATAVPKSRQEVEQYLASIRPALRCDERTREVARALLNQPPPSMAAAPFQRPLMDAGIDLLPGWAAEMHGLKRGLARTLLARSGTQALQTALHSLLQEGAAARARRRVLGQAPDAKR